MFVETILKLFPTYEGVIQEIITNIQTMNKEVLECLVEPEMFELLALANAFLEENSGESFNAISNDKKLEEILK